MACIVQHQAAVRHAVNSGDHLHLCGKFFRIRRSASCIDNIRRIIKGINPFRGLFQVACEAGCGNKEHDTQGKRYDRRAVAPLVTLEVLGRHGSFKTEQLLCKPGGSDRFRTDLNSRVLADCHDRRYTERAARGDEGRNQYRQKTAERCQKKRLRVQHEVHDSGSFRVKHRFECVTQEVQRCSDADTSHKKSDGDCDHGKDERLKENRPSDLSSGCTDRLQDSVLFRPFCNRNGKHHL